MGPCVLGDVEAVVGEATVAGAAERGIEDLGAAVGQGLHRRAAVLGPEHGTTGAAGELTEEEVLRVRNGLGPEAATDVGHDHVDLLERQTVVVGVHPLRGVGALARELLDEPITLPPGRRHPRLQRARCDPLVHDPLADHDLGFERLGRRRLGAHGHVRPVVGMDQHLVGEGGLDADDRLERVVVDDDGLGGVDGLGQGLGHDGDDRLPHEPDHVGGQDRPGEGGRHRHHARGGGVVGEVGGGHDGQHARHRQGFADVDPGDAAVGQRRAHELHVGEALRVEVGDVGRHPREEARVLDALDLVAKDAHGLPQSPGPTPGDGGYRRRTAASGTDSSDAAAVLVRSTAARSSAPRDVGLPTPLGTAMDEWPDQRSTAQTGARPGAREENRTPDLLITSELLCRLSYPGG